MNDFLSRLVLRTLASQPVLRPRLPSRYEPLAASSGAAAPLEAAESREERLVQSPASREASAPAPRAPLGELTRPKPVSEDAGTGPVDRKVVGAGDVGLADAPETRSPPEQAPAPRGLSAPTPFTVELAEVPRPQAGPDSAGALPVDRGRVVSRADAALVENDHEEREPAIPPSIPSFHGAQKMLPPQRGVDLTPPAPARPRVGSEAAVQPHAAQRTDGQRATKERGNPVRVQPETAPTGRTISPASISVAPSAPSRFERVSPEPHIESVTAAAAPTVRVTIGRVEVKAIMPAPPARTPAPAPRGPRVTLDDYLRRQSRERR